MEGIGYLLLLFALYAAAYTVLWVLTYCCLGLYDYCCNRRRRRLELGSTIPIRDLLAREAGHPRTRSGGGRHRRKPVRGKHVRVQQRPARRSGSHRRVMTDTAREERSRIIQQIPPESMTELTIEIPVITTEYADAA